MEKQNQVIYDTFLKYFTEGNKEQAVFYILKQLEEKKIDVIEVYENILTPALNHTPENEDERIKIWNEHLRSGIVRTIVECCYPYVLEKKKEYGFCKNKSAVMLCPPEEYHDIGARMAADFLLICGMETIFIGANTPYEDCIEAIKVTKPDVIGISISNYYNLIATEKMIEKIRTAANYPVTILVGGSALSGNKNIGKQLRADYEVYRFLDIKNIMEQFQEKL